MDGGPRRGDHRELLQPTMKAIDYPCLAATGERSCRTPPREPTARGGASNRPRFCARDQPASCIRRTRSGSGRYTRRACLARNGGCSQPRMKASLLQERSGAGWRASACTRITLAPAGSFELLPCAGWPSTVEPTRRTAHVPHTFQISEDTAGRASRRSVKKGGGAHSFRRSAVSRKRPARPAHGWRDRGGSNDDCRSGTSPLSRQLFRRSADAQQN